MPIDINKLKRELRKSLQHLQQLVSIFDFSLILHLKLQFFKRKDRQSSANIILKNLCMLCTLVSYIYFIFETLVYNFNLIILLYTLYLLCIFFQCATKFMIYVHIPIPIGQLMLSLMPLITNVSHSPWRIVLYFWYWWRKMRDFRRSDMLDFATHNPTGLRISWEHFSYGNWPNSVANWHSFLPLNWRKDTVVFACWNNNEHQQR